MRSLARGGFDEPLASHPAQALPLARTDRVERPGRPAARACDARLDLAEDERALVDGDEIELSVARPEVAREDPVAVPLEVLLGEALADCAVSTSGVGCHAGEATPGSVTAGSGAQEARYGSVNFT